MSAKHHASLADRYQKAEGSALLTGIHAIVRGLLEQSQQDKKVGLHTGIFCSGYQGSPLGTLDKEMFANEKILRENSIVFQPGLNEELAATSVMGSQLAPSFPGANVEGVVGVWYGKAPGLDRASDALRHANLAGTHPLGGAILLCGDDPASKSSTVPSASERSLAALMIPTLYPSSPAETVEMIQYAVEMSRHSGVWVAVKIVTDIADAYASIDLGKTPVIPRLQGTHKPDNNLLAPNNLALEQDLLDNRIPRALAYARAAKFNQSNQAKNAKLGIVASGKTYVDVCEAFALVGTSPEQLNIRLMKIDMLWPHDEAGFVEFAKGLDEVLIVEEKGPFIETAFYKALYADGPLITGQNDEDGVLVRSNGQLTVDVILSAIAKRCQANGIKLDTGILQEMKASTQPAVQTISRVPYFCSGCPHNSSTLAEGLVGGGIGCHTMVLLAPKGKGEVMGITQMGGEGSQWIGISPFTADHHFIQNLGDGTFHHSASLAVRASVAAKTNITYKLLFNSAVAMTGGQEIPGGMDLPHLTHALWAEGVKKIIICTENRSQYKNVAKNVEFAGKEDIQIATQSLAKISGTTVLVYDGECAAERRRKRKRDKAPQATKRVIINERVCEGCGNCGIKSSCLSVVPKSTVFGRKTEIAQDSCNTDFSCLEGDCPSFVTVKASTTLAKNPPKAPKVKTPVFYSDALRVRIVGVGGTGIVTTSQVLAQAAILDGKSVCGLDQTGLAQKGGTVTSDIEINKSGSGKIPPGQADLFVVLDLVAGSSTQPLTACGPRTTVVASSTPQATIETVTDVNAQMPSSETMLSEIQDRCKSTQSLPFHSYADTLFGNSMLASMMMLGYCIQKSLIPIAPDAMLAAIQLNQVDVQRNSEAFRWGQALAEGHKIEQAQDALPEAPLWIRKQAAKLHLSEDAAALAGELARWGSKKDAKAFLATLQELSSKINSTIAPSLQTQMQEALALQLFSVWAYKDEYEIARLHLDAAQIAKRESLFGKAKITYHLQPPMLRAMGMKRKLKLGAWFTGVFRILKALKFLRGTPLDLFGATRVRRAEKALLQEYVAWITQALESSNKRNASQVLEVIELAKRIKGYEDIKMENIAWARGKAEEILAEIHTGQIRIALPMV